MMQPFNAEAVCPKCAGTDLSNRWCEAHSWASSSHRTFSRGDYHQEHIHRHCRCCHYEWLEAPLDATRLPTAGEGGRP